MHVIYDSNDSSTALGMTHKALGMTEAPLEAIPEVPPTPSAFKRAYYRGFQFIGASMTSFAMAAFMFTYSPLVSANYSAKLTSREADRAGEQESVGITNTTGGSRETSKPSRFNANTSVFQEAKKYGVDTTFSIVVPAIGAKSRVLPHIDPYNEAEYSEALKAGIAHAKGTYLPGQGKSIYLFAHSTNSPLTVSQYNAVFYQLKELQPGNRILVFYDLGIYEYEVAEKVVVAADDTSWLMPTDGERLILQTCDPPGTTWKRLLVIAKPV